MPIGTVASPTRTATGPPVPIHSDFTDPEVIPKQRAAPAACSTAAVCGPRRLITAAPSAARPTTAPTTAAAAGNGTTGAAAVIRAPARCGTIASTAGRPNTTQPAPTQATRVTRTPPNRAPTG